MKKNWLLIGGVAAAAWYFFLKNKTIPTTTTTVPGTTPKIPPTTNVPIQTETVVVVPESSKSYVYPLGRGKDGSTFILNEGDYVANGTESAVLYNGQLRPFTKAWGDVYAWGTWDRTKILDEVVYSSIPRGAVLDL